VVGEFLKLNSNKKLTKTALETLSIIAYKQPVAKSEIEQIRGVNADYTIHKLMEKELVEISGRSDGPGRPILYSTSEKFMDYFGLRSIQDLPKLKDLEIEKNTIGEPASLEMHSNSEEE
jgi:segregation and condensation protein B